MFVSWPLLVLLGFGVFCVGTVVGSFLNVCIYRIPWQKSVIWPASHCPRCLNPIGASDNIPIVGWLALRGECRSCGLPIAARYPLIEALVGLLFLGLYVVDVILAEREGWGQIPVSSLATLAYHCLLVALLVAATFIDYDLLIIPDEVTVTGMVLGVGLGAAFPWIRPEPSTAATFGAGLWVGVLGLLIGGGLTASIRSSFSFLLRREAMGFGDVTLMAMIGAFLGWRAAKLAKYIGKRLAGAQSSSADREIPAGPYISMAAVFLLFSWRWLWPLWAKNLFDTFYALFWWSLGVDVGPMF